MVALMIMRSALFDCHCGRDPRIGFAVSHESVVIERVLSGPSVSTPHRDLAGSASYNPVSPPQKLQFRTEFGER